MPLEVEVNQVRSDVALLWLLTFRDPNNQLVLRAVNNLEPVVSRSNTYHAYPFQVKLPPMDGKKPPTELQLSFMYHPALIQLVREYNPSELPRVKLELVLSSDPDTVEKRIDFLQVGSVDYNVERINFTLLSSAIWLRKTINQRYDQKQWPGIFRGFR